MIPRYALVLLLLAAACGPDPCGAVEGALEQCSQTAYLGDDNCELLLEPCSDDELVVIEAWGNCYTEGTCAAACDNHLNRLSDRCFYALFPGAR